LQTRTLPFVDTKFPEPHISVESSMESERPPSFLSANRSQDLTAQGSSPELVFFVSEPSPEALDLFLRAFALNPMSERKRTASRNLGSHCCEPSPSCAINPSMRRSRPRSVTSDTLAMEQISDCVLGEPDSLQAL